MRLNGRGFLGLSEIQLHEATAVNVASDRIASHASVHTEVVGQPVHMGEDPASGQAAGSTQQDPLPFASHAPCG